MTYFHIHAYIIVMWSVKASFICNYFTLRSHLNKRIMYALYATTGVTICTFILSHFCLIFWCRPMSRYWYDATAS